MRLRIRDKNERNIQEFKVKKKKMSKGNRRKILSDEEKVIGKDFS